MISSYSESKGLMLHKPVVLKMEEPRVTGKLSQPGRPVKMSMAIADSTSSAIRRTSISSSTPCCQAAASLFIASKRS